MLIVATLVVAALGAVLTLAVLTGLGDRRRGHVFPHIVLAAVLFPVSWMVWYLVDERPYQRC